MDADNRCVPGQNDMVYRVNGDGSGLQEVGVGHHPRWGSSPLPGQPVAMFTATCNGVSCQFDAAGSFDPDGSITSYVWDFGDGTTGTGATAAHHYATGANYIVRLTVTDNSGTSGISTRNVTANTPPVASFTVTCSGLTCTFDGSASSDSDGTITRFSWTFGDGSSLQSSGATTTHAYGAAGTYQPSLTVSDAANQIATSTGSVTVAPPPPPPPPPVLELHVGNLSGTATTAKNAWNALVTVQIHRDTHAAIGGVTVSGRWSDAATATCVTDTLGKCVLSRNGLATKTSSITLTVAGATFGTYVYKPAANHDVDGGSNGTSIVVKRK
jgi:PKD repeat protein